MFVLAFCVFEKATYARDITPALQFFKFKHFGHDMVVLHEHEIRKAVGPFKFLIDVHKSLRGRRQGDRITHVIFEARGKKEDDELELEFRRVCDGANYRNERLPLEIVIANKQINSCGLQLADLIARPIGRKLLKPEQPNRAYEVLEAKFDRSPQGRIEGWGLKVFP